MSTTERQLSMDRSFADWTALLSRALEIRGFASLTAYTDRRPRASLAQLATELGGDIPPCGPRAEAHHRSQDRWSPGALRAESAGAPPSCRFPRRLAERSGHERRRDEGPPIPPVRRIPPARDGFPGGLRGCHCSRTAGAHHGRSSHGVAARGSRRSCPLGAVRVILDRAADMPCRQRVSGSPMSPAVLIRTARSGAGAAVGRLPRGPPGPLEVVATI